MYDIEKIANAIKYFKQHKVKHLGKTKLMKLLFFVDKYHLKEYSKPVFYDKYFKLPFGPVPSLTLNIIDSLNEIENTDLDTYSKAFSKHIQLKETTFNSNVKRLEFEIIKPFDNDYFSKSELEIMDIVIKQFKNMNANEISEYSHTLPEYQNTPLNEIIDYSQMSDDNSEFIEFIESLNNELDEVLS